MTESEKRKARIMCKHEFRPADDLPSNQWRCVKCANAGIMDSIQTQDLTPAQERKMRAIHRKNVLSI
jgi:hypothetical protein